MPSDPRRPSIDRVEAERDSLLEETAALDRRIDECEALLSWYDDAEALLDRIEKIDEELHGPVGWPHLGLYQRWAALIQQADALDHEAARREDADRRLNSPVVL